MRLLDTRTDLPAIEAALAQTNSWDRPELEASVRALLADVRARGDAAVCYTLRRFDGIEIETFAASEAEYDAADAAVAPATRRAMERAAERIAAFHSRPEGRTFSWTFERDGVQVGQTVRPLRRVGICVPAGQAPLPSTLLMAAIPAREAGVAERVVCSVPRRDGSVAPAMLLAARLADVTTFYKIGGPAAVGAMAYGTEQVPRVDKIVGPGAPATVIAKRLVFGEVDIESLPGPTEIVVIADDSADPAWVAADLLAQAEHADDSLAVLLTPSAALARAVADEVERQLADLSRREVAEKCLGANGYLIVTRDLEEACALSNARAPEHVELIVANPEAWADRLVNAGAVFLGGHSSEPLGDYLAGPSHILPTGGTARFASPLSVHDFLKRTTVMRYSEAALRADADDVIAFAETEGLTAHANAIRVRLKERS